MQNFSIHGIEKMNKAWGLLGLAATACAQSWAADGFSLRHNMTGSLGSEMFSVSVTPGWSGVVSYAHTSIDRVTGDDGQMLRTTVPGGSIKIGATPNPTQDPTYPAQSVGVAVTGAQRIFTLALTRTSDDLHAGGRWQWMAIVPYGVKTTQVKAINTIPALAWPSTSVLSGAAQGSVSASVFSPQYQAGIDQLAESESGESTGWGDTELIAQWVKSDASARLILGTGLIVPTGRYSSMAGPDIGSGNFYTFKPQMIYVRRWEGKYAAGVRMAYGINSTNRDNDVRSGNFAGVELALSALTSVGSIGVHWMHARQTQDDTGGSWGTNRYRQSTAGLSFATLIPDTHWGLSIQTSRSLASRNAQEGGFTQIKLGRSF
jgi:hypothetical protein